MHPQRTLYLLLMAAIMFAFDVPYASAEQTKPLNSAELRELLTGNTLAGNGKANAPVEPYDWAAYYNQDGTIILQLKPTSIGLIMKGRWWLTEHGQQCRKFETGHKKEGCWHYFREGDTLRFVPTSGVAVEGRAVRLKGDTFELNPKH